MCAGLHMSMGLVAIHEVFTVKKCLLRLHLQMMIPQVITAVEFVTSNSLTFSFARRFTLSTKTDRNASCHATRMHVA